MWQVICGDVRILHVSIAISLEGRQHWRFTMESYVKIVIRRRESYIYETVPATAAGRCVTAISIVWTVSVTLLLAVGALVLASKIFSSAAGLGM